LLALLCSPLAVAVCGRPVQTGVNLGLWVLALLIAPAGFPFVVAMPLAHAVLVVHWYRWDQRLEAMVRSVQQRSALVQFDYPNRRNGRGQCRAS
jgi:hypothetical protein